MKDKIIELTPQEFYSYLMCAYFRGKCILGSSYHKNLKDFDEWFGDGEWIFTNYDCIYEGD